MDKLNKEFNNQNLELERITILEVDFKEINS